MVQRIQEYCYLQPFETEQLGILPQGSRDQCSLCDALYACEVLSALRRAREGPRPALRSCQSQGFSSRQGRSTAGPSLLACLLLPAHQPILLISSVLQCFPLPRGPAGNGSLLARHSPLLEGRHPSILCCQQNPQSASRLWPRPGGVGWERVCGELCTWVRSDVGPRPALPGEGHCRQVWQVGKQSHSWVTFLMFAFVWFVGTVALALVVVPSAELCWR